MTCHQMFWYFCHISSYFDDDLFKRKANINVEDFAFITIILSEVACYKAEMSIRYPYIESFRKGIVSYVTVHEKSVFRKRNCA